MPQDLFPPASSSGGLTDAELRATPVPVSDGGGSLTVDGPLTDAQLRASAIAVTGAAGTFPVTDNSGSLTVDDGGLTLSIDDGAGSITVDGTVGVSGSVAVTGSFWQSTQPVSIAATVEVVGAAAHDAVVAGNPVRIAAYARSSAPVAVSIDGDTVNLWADRNGRLQIGDGDASLTVDAPVGTPVFVRLSDGAAAITTLPVDTELPAAAALSDTTSNPTTPTVGAAGMLWDDTQWVREQAKVEGTLLASAARTLTTSSSNVTSRTAKGVILYLRVTSAGTGTLQVVVNGVDPISAVSAALLLSNTMTGAGTYTVVMAPGAGSTAPGSSSVWGITGIPLPKTWNVAVNKSDASSWTYSLGYCLIP